LLWCKIVEIDQDNYNQSLLESLQDYYLQETEEFKGVSNLFSLTEKERQDLFRIPELIEQSILALEQAHLEKYSQLCLQKFLKEQTDYYWQEFSQTKLKINELIEERQSLNKNI
jgi:hypothetical protein